MAKTQKTQAEIIDALQKTGGVISETAKLLELSSVASFRARVRSTPALQEALDEIREQTKDLAEGNVISALKSGDKDMSKWYLASLGRDRGYGNRAEIDLNARVTVQKRDLGKLSDEELDALETTLEKIEPADAG